MEQRVIIPGQIYQHFKGNLYQIITIGKHSETGEDMVVYQAMYGEFQVYIRSVSMFLEKLDLERYPEAKQQYRFTLVKSLYEKDEKQLFQEKNLELKTEVVVATETTENDNQSEKDENEQKKEVEEIYLSFFDAETCKEKLHIINTIKSDIDLRMLNNIAASMDLPVDEDSAEGIFEIIVKNLEQRSRFECNRFR